MSDVERAVRESLVGQVLDGRYRLRASLGAGAFGFVMAADWDVGGSVVSTVAVKLIEISQDRQEQLDELKEALRLSHPSLVRNHSVGEAPLVVAGREVRFLYLAMELAAGTLESELRNGLLGAAEAMKLGSEISSALGYLRQQDRVHRDLKPSNILRLREGWKLADLGILRSLEAGATTDADPSGTLWYMPPEAHEGVLSPSWDVWSLGVVLMEALTNQRPYEAKSRGEWFYRIRKEEPHIPLGIPEPLNTVIRGCLVKDRGKRLRPAAIVDTLRSGLGALPDRPTTDVIVVAPSGSDSSSVREAVRSARPGSKILVKPGTYRGTVLLDRPVELVAWGAAADIVLDGGSQPALVVATSEAVVRGFALRSSEPPATGTRAVVEVRSGHSTVDLCEVTSPTTDGLYVLGRSAQPVIRRTRFLAGARYGVKFDSDAEGLMESCVVSGSAIAGIVISDGANPVIRRTSVKVPGMRGVSVSQDGSGIVEECSIDGGSGAAIELGRGATTIVRNTTLRLGLGAGVMARSGAKAVFIGTEFDGPEDRHWDLAPGHQVKR